MTHPFWQIAALLASLCACDRGVGRALVDHRNAVSEMPQACRYVHCQSPLKALEVPTIPGDFGDFAGCDAPAITSADLPLKDCRCRSYELQIDKTSARTVASTGDLLNCRLHLSADEPVDVELANVKLTNVGITLTGPISLHVRDAQLERVRVRSAFSDAGEPALQLETSAVMQLALANDGPPMATLWISHSTLVSSLLQAEATRFESVALHQSSLDTNEFDANDLNIIESELKLDHALVSISTLSTVRISRCGQVRFVGGQLSGMEIAACAERLQLYSLHVSDSMLDGNIEADKTEFDATGLGVQRDTSLTGYESLLANVTFCDHFQRFRAWGGSASCVNCGAQFASGGGFCMANAPFATTGNACAALDHPSTCDDLPPSSRPK